VLRGGSKGPNYDSVTIALVEQALAKSKLPGNIIVDASHANSNKDAALQPLVMHDIAVQIADGNQSIVGVMIESNIGFGSQSIPADLSQLRYGVSVTDACLDWERTEKVLREVRAKIRDPLRKRARPEGAEVVNLR